MIMKNYVADELSNKVYYLQQALTQAKEIISVLEKENQNLKEVVKFLENEEELAPV